MKYKICISVDEETLLKIKKSVKKRIFRNRSHAFEASVNKVLKEKGDKENDN